MKTKWRPILALKVFLILYGPIFAWFIFCAFLFPDGKIPTRHPVLLLGIAAGVIPLTWIIVGVVRELRSQNEDTHCKGGKGEG